MPSLMRAFFITVLQTIYNTNMLLIEYKRLDEITRHSSNPKEHDIGAIIESIKAHKYRVPVVWDDTTQSVLAGNGRVEAVNYMFTMYQSGNLDKVPEGIEVDTDEMWMIPCVVGVNADSVEQAEAFLIDDNNLTVMGGDFTALDASRMWDIQGYLAMLEKVVDTVVTVDRSDLALMKQLASMEPPEPEPEPEPDEPKQPSYVLKFSHQEDVELLKSWLADNATGELSGNLILANI